MRKLPIKRSPQQKLVIEAVFDFYGSGISQQEIPRAKAIAIYLMGRKKNNPITEKEFEDIWYIKNNLGDKIYRENLLNSP